MTRRAFLATPIAVLATVHDATAAGIHLTGRLDATETERSEQTVNFGKACAIFVNDAAMWDAIQPLIGSEVTLSLVQP